MQIIIKKNEKILKKIEKMVKNDKKRPEKPSQHFFFGKTASVTFFSTK